MGEWVQHGVGLAAMSEAPRQGSLLARTAKATGWMIVWRLVTRVLGLGSTLVLVRLLLPSDFGLVALGTSFAQAIDALSIIGVDDALIREKQPDRAIYNTAFTMNAIRNVFTALLIAATAVPVGAFFNEPRLAHILLALALATAVEAFENVGIIDFRRDLTFDKEFKLRLVPRLAAILTTITLAVLLRTYWALVAGILVGRILRVGMSYVMHPYRPGFTLIAWRRIIGFSLWTWVISLGVLVRDRAGSFIIGRLLNTTQVGFYSVAGEIATLPGSELLQPLNRALFSAFAVAKHSGESIAETYLRVTGTAMLLMTPASVGIGLVAEPIVRLAFGPSWMEVAPLIQVIVIGSIIGVPGALSCTLFSSHGILAPMFRIQMASLLIGVPLFAILLPRFGLLSAMILSMPVGIAEQAIYVWRTMQRYDVRAHEMVAQTWRPVLASIVMAAIVIASGLNHATADSVPSRLAAPLVGAVALGVVSYSATLLGLWLAAGRPRGAETDMLGVLQRVYAPLGSMLRASRALIG